MRILCISGHPGHGGTTSARILQRFFRGYGKRAPIVRYGELPELFSVRLGTDVARQENPAFWTEHLVSILKKFKNNWDYVIIPDCRYLGDVLIPEESGLDVTHIRVSSDIVDNLLWEDEPAAPPELDNCPADFLVVNNGTFADLARDLIEIAIRIYKKDQGTEDIGLA